MKNHENKNDTNEKGPKKDEFIHPECKGEKIEISPEVPNNLKELMDRQVKRKVQRKVNSEISDTTKEVLKLLSENQAGPKEDIEIAGILTSRLCRFYSDLVSKLVDFEVIEKEILVSLTKDTDRLSLANMILSNIEFCSIQEEEEEEEEEEEDYEVDFVDKDYEEEEY
tara:strand:- start:131 stop:634 length:504 start_codon:yes stop_codon:yes gene_type:complete